MKMSKIEISEKIWVSELLLNVEIWKRLKRSAPIKWVVRRHSSNRARKALYCQEAIKRRKFVHLWAIYYCELSKIGFRSALGWQFKRFSQQPFTVGSPIVVMTVNENKKAPEKLHWVSPSSTVPFRCRSISFIWNNFISVSTLLKRNRTTTNEEIKKTLPIKDLMRSVLSSLVIKWHRWMRRGKLKVSFFSPKFGMKGELELLSVINRRHKFVNGSA